MGPFRTALGTLLLGWMAGCGTASLELPRQLDGVDAGTSDAGSEGREQDAARDGGAPGDASQAEGGAGFDAALPPEGAAGLDAGAGDAGDAGAADADAGGQESGALDGEAGASECVPGTYRGTFEGTLSLDLGFVDFSLFDISGEIEIEALTSDTGDQLTLEGGRIDGADDDGNPVTADVNGVLDCASLQLVGGTLDNGVYTRTAFSQTVSFSGVVEATYIPGAVPRVSGTWMTSGGIESGEGTFEAALSEAAAP